MLGGRGHVALEPGPLRREQQRQRTSRSPILSARQCQHLLQRGASFAPVPAEVPEPCHQGKAEGCVSVLPIDQPVERGSDVVVLLLQTLQILHQPRTVEPAAQRLDQVGEKCGMPSTYTVGSTGRSQTFLPVLTQSFQNAITRRRSVSRRLYRDQRFVR